MDGIAKAKQKGQAFQISPNCTEMRWPQIYALPTAPLKFKLHELESMSGNFLLFGPYLRNSNSGLLLMQNVEGKMYLRDDYERINNINRKQRTRCLWIYANTLKCIKDAYTDNIKLTQNISDDISDVSGEIENVDDDDDDDDEQSQSFEETSQNLKISSIVGNFQEVL